MDPWDLRPEIADAIALDDELRRRHEAFDTWMAEREPREMVYKTHEPKPVQQSAAVGDAAWNRWFSESFQTHIERHDELFTDVTVEFVCEYVHKRLKDEVTKLQAEIGQLRADITVLQGIVRGEISQIKGKASDAA